MILGKGALRPCASRTLLVAVALLAGCADAPTEGPRPGETSHETSAPAATLAGTLDVFVLDLALRPLPGAIVTVHDDAEATNEQGLARFTDVPAGTAVVTVTLDGYRTATSGAHVAAGQRTQAEVKLLASIAPDAALPTNETRREQFHLRGYFDCSATYLIITGDCMLLVDTVTASAGAGTPAGDATSEEFMLDFPLDHGWASIVGEMHWEPNGAANGEQMTFALEPTEFDTSGHAPKYARSEGGSPLRWVVHAGEPHASATASADGVEPDMPNEMGGEVVRTRSYVAGQFLHRPAGTTFLGIGAAVSQEFEVIVTVFYGERAAEEFSVA